MNQKGQSLTAGNLQELLDSAKNATEIGAQQFYTPADYAAAFALALGKHHGSALDFQMGAGNLLAGLDPDFTFVKLGVDIDERTRKPDKAPGAWQTMRGDTTRLYELWRDVGFHADTIVLNPPFSLRWYVDRLEGLKESSVNILADVAKDTLHGETIDSTLASFMIALDRLTLRGEGFMVCNENTARRWFGDPDSAVNDPKIPTSRLRNHVWLWLTVPASFFENVVSDMPVAVLYFARNHVTQCPVHLVAQDNSLPAIQNCLRMAAQQRQSLLRGARIHSDYDYNKEAPFQFEAAKQEYGFQFGQKDRPFNIWLDDNGVIQRHLTNYQKASVRVDGTETRKLHALQGQRPMALVVQKATRTALISVLKAGIWKVQPELLATVERCMAEYEAVRAPFYPLNEVQRLGYLDEEDKIVCKVSMGDAFVAGQSYALCTSTRKTVRKGEKMSMAGTKQETELSGLELYITITDAQQYHHEFTHHCEHPGEFSHRLEVLLDHFTIPDVADVARLKPEQYERNLTRLRELEDLINQNRRPAAPPGMVPISPGSAATSLTAGASSPLSLPIASRIPLEARSRSAQAFYFRGYQRDDLARSALHDGLVFAWDTGLGKTAAIFGWSWLHHPAGARAVLIVAPGGLHEQIIKDAREIFGLEVKRLYSADDLRRDALLQSIHLASLNGKAHPLQASHRPCYWITSYIDLGFTGADEWTPKEDDAGGVIVNSRLERERNRIPYWKPEYNTGIGEQVTYEAPALGNKDDGSEAALPSAICHLPHTVRCVHKPSLATLVADLFDAVALDEAVAIKATDSYRSLGVRRLNPKFRLVLTATPVKNHLDDIFWLVQWATGGHDEPTARWPYENTAAAKERFANEHMVMERNITAEQDALRKGGRFKTVRKRIPQLCNVHHLWKLLGPCIVRRRKADTAEDLVAKKIVPIRTVPGTMQKTVYGYHLAFPPTVNKAGEEMNELASIGAQLTNLRQAALCPDSENLRAAGGGMNASCRSWSDFNPKSAAILALVESLIQQGEQVVIMSPFEHFNDCLFRRLRDAGVSVCLLDGKTAPLKRGVIADQFKERRFAVLIGGIDSMGAGYSFENASHMVLPSLSWAFDSNEQAINRVHRLNSPKEVTIYTMVVEGTIDEKLADLFQEKGDCSSLALDGRLFAEDKKEINLFELLRDAVRNFKPDAKTVSELAVEQEWPALRARLHVAEKAFRQWHPPILARNPVTSEPCKVKPAELIAAANQMDNAVAEVEAREAAGKGVPLTSAIRAANFLRDL